MAVFGSPILRGLVFVKIVVIDRAEEIVFLVRAIVGGEAVKQSIHFRRRHVTRAREIVFIGWRVKTMGGQKIHRFLRFGADIGQVFGEIAVVIPSARKSRHGVFVGVIEQNRPFVVIEFGDRREARLLEQALGSDRGVILVSPFGDRDGRGADASIGNEGAGSVTEARRK